MSVHVDIMEEELSFCWGEMFRLLNGSQRSVMKIEALLYAFNNLFVHRTR